MSGLTTRNSIVDAADRLFVGRLHAGSGGAMVSQDPFVAEGVVTAEILQITPTRADERLAFLLA